MPFFKTTENIFKDNGEYFSQNWMDNPNYLPEKTEWLYDRNIYIEDVDLWEVIHFNTHGPSVYASWSPYAEYYIIVYPIFSSIPLEEYYGDGVQIRLQKRMKELGIPFSLNKIWVEEDKIKFYV